MINYEDILSLLFNSFISPEIKETTSFFTYEATCSKSNKDIDEKLTKLFSDEVYKDKTEITITVNDAPFKFDSEAGNNDLFFSSWAKFHSKEADDDVTNIFITITKSIQDCNLIRIYHPSVFYLYLQELSLGRLFGVFTDLFKKSSAQIFFISPDISSPFFSASIFFIKSPDERKLASETVDHVKIWDRLKSIGHFSGVNNCLVLPEDFYILEAGEASPELLIRFKNACLVLSMAAIFDYSELKDNSFSFKLNGYKTFDFAGNVSAMKTDCLNSYYQIYKWIGQGGSIQDKTGLARNLISLNLDTDGYSVSPAAITSIYSGFKVYEKQNIKQYIELRNKMSDQLISFNEKASKIVDNFAGSFQKSALAVVSLFATFIVTRVLTSHDFLNVFTLDATVLSLIFLLISLGYYFVCIWEIREQRKRYVDSYGNMKRRNEDLLTKEDIDKVLNNDQEYNADLLFIDGKRQMYSRLWLLVICMFAFATIVLHIIYIIHSN